jgi:hypothetical protein
MSFIKKTVTGIILMYVPDIMLVAGVLYYVYSYDSKDWSAYEFFSVMLPLVIIVRIAAHITISEIFHKNRLAVIKEIINEYKKGKFLPAKSSYQAEGEVQKIVDDLVLVGKHLDSIVSSQKNEIEKFNELYNNIIFSISSYFLVLDENELIVFANEGFCKKFIYEQDAVAGRRIEDLFYFVNARLKGGISQARRASKTVILEKTHLLSLNKVSIIADIKISNMAVKGRNQIIIMIDDVTGKLRKDYQLSLMSQITESIQSDEEIDRILFTILTGVTSGSGLGFNRAILFLVESEFLNGKMAVGPDSFEEAIEIWSSVSQSGSIIEEIESSDKRSGRKFLKKVLSARYMLSDDNLFTRALKQRKYMHVPDIWNDEGIDENVKELLDVKEFVIVPLVVGNRAIGLIVADNKFNQAPIGHESIELLSIFASQAALSIESFESLESVKREMDKIRNRQDAIVESEKMAAVGRIAAHIAHEIRNPLVTMGGYSRRVIQLSADPLKNKTGIANAANIILKESERLEKILSNVMDFTRPSKYIREFNNINDIIIDTTELLRNLFLERKVEIILSLKKEVPLVKSDFNQMKQVMLNLLQNALDATPAGGSIEILTETDDNDIIVKVMDTGTGISEDNPDIVFEPFFTTKVTGVGLGLANVKKIIKDHGGDIKVKNRETGDEITGVEFEIRLPLPV